MSNRVFVHQPSDHTDAIDREALARDLNGLQWVVNDVIRKMDRSALSDESVEWADAWCYQVLLEVSSDVLAGYRAMIDYASPSAHNFRADLHEALYERIGNVADHVAIVTEW